MNANKTNSNENDDLQRFYRAMAILRQKIESLQESTPNLLKINNLTELPSEKAKIVENQLWAIFVYGEYYVEKLILDCSGEPIVSASEDGKAHFDYHQKEYKSFVNKLKGLIDVSNAPERKEVELVIACGDPFAAISLLFRENWTKEVTEQDMTDYFTTEHSMPTDEKVACPGNHRF